MDSVGMVVSSAGMNVIVHVTSDDVELGSILRIGDYYAIVAEMRYVEDDKIGSKHRLMAESQVFGRISNGRLKKIKRPVKPYEHVFLANEKELEGMLAGDDTISIGNVYGTKARAMLKAGEYDRHIAILASTGSGKSYTTANLIKEYSRLGLPVLVVDTHGEYPNLLSAMTKDLESDIVVYTVRHQRAGCKSLKIPVSDLEPSDFHHFIHTLTEPQESALMEIVGILSGKDYTIDDMVAECDNLDTEKWHEGTIAAIKRKLEGIGRTFKDVFDKYGTDTKRLVEPNQITIIDASLAPQAVRRAVISYFSKELLTGRMNHVNDMGDERIEYPLLFVVEEAHNYGGSKLQHSCKYQLQRIASEGRKFGIGLCVISQKPSKIDEEILSQCNTGIYMHITNPRDKDHIRSSFESINDAIISDLDSLDVGECIIAGALVDIPFLLCEVDHIEVPRDRKPKFNFPKKTKPKVAGFGYT